MRYYLEVRPKKANGCGDLLHPDNCGNGYSIEDFTKEKNNCWGGVPETIGQYTGLSDKNGTKIFESDILLVDEGEEYEMRVQVEMQCGCWLIYKEELNRGFLALGTTHCKVIGNIHDNPELLEGSDNNA